MVAGAALGITTSIGFSQGFYWGFLIGIIPVALAWFIGMPFLLFHTIFAKEYPDCACGARGAKTYRFLKMEKDPLSFDYECLACHRRYRSKNDVFFELVPDGAEKPYMRRSGFGWRHCQQHG